VHERYPIPTHTPFTQVCCELHIGEQGISNNIDIDFLIYFFSINLPVVVVVLVIVIVAEKVDAVLVVVVVAEEVDVVDVAEEVAEVAEVDVVDVSVVVSKYFCSSYYFCMNGINFKHNDHQFYF
jgi:hypothetical protein